MCVCVCGAIQHEVEICRSEQPFIIQSQCAESFTGADSQLVSPTADDHPLTHDVELPGPSGLSGQPADDVNVVLSSAIDINDVVLKSAPPSKSMMCAFCSSLIKSICCDSLVCVQSNDFCLFAGHLFFLCCLFNKIGLCM